MMMMKKKKMMMMKKKMMKKKSTMSGRAIGVISCPVKVPKQHIAALGG